MKDQNGELVTAHKPAVCQPRPISEDFLAAGGFSTERPSTMPQPIKSKKRNSRQTGVRIYVDQLQALQSLAEGKYRGRVTIADLIREAVDRFLDKEDPDWFKG